MHICVYIYIYIYNEATLRVYFAAHAVLVLASALMLIGSCEGSPLLLPNAERSVGGLEFISETLMQCQHSASLAQRLPQIIGSVMSVIMLQNLATFQTLAPTPGRNVWDCVFGVLLVLTVLTWGLLISNDHHPHRVLNVHWANAELTHAQHVYSVVSFMACYFAVHVLISRWYMAQRAMHSRFAMLRRVSYFAADTIYILLCVLFSVFAVISNVYHAIMIEYVVALLFFTLNAMSLVVLTRINEWQLLQPSDPELP